MFVNPGFNTYKVIFRECITKFTYPILSILSILTVLFVLVNSTQAQVSTDTVITKSNLTSTGSLHIYNFEGWQFSSEVPISVRDTINLKNTVEISSLRDFSIVRNSDSWNHYGWFENSFEVDSTLAGIPFILQYSSQEPVNVWLNGKLVLSAGVVTQTPDDEVLSRYVNPITVGVMLREGVNYVLVEYSSHKIRPIHSQRRIFTNGIFLSLLEYNEPFRRRERAFIFGGALLLLFNLVLIHLYLAYRFKGTYHIFVALTTLFLLLHAFSTLSDTLFDWTYSYTYFAAYTYALAYLVGMYFFIISIRKFYDLTIPWKQLTVSMLILCVPSVIWAESNFEYLGYLQQVIMILVVAYGGWSLRKAWIIDKDRSIFIIAGGLAMTMFGAFIYVVLIVILSRQIDWLFYLATLLSYASIPISLTLVVASSYAKLISTLEDKVSDRTAKLEKANEYQMRFFANVSHEFRTPLTISEGLLVKVLNNDQLDNESIRYDLLLAKRNMVRLHYMVNQIIELTKADHNELKLNKQLYYASDIVNISVESFRSLAESYGHTFDYVPTDEVIVINVDMAKIEIIINNLISNAIKYTPAGGEIRISTKLTGDKFVLQVADSGPGIPPEKRELIFERFHRITKPDSDYVEGMGVGLELSRTLARLHHGDIDVYDNSPSGSIFELALPVSENYSNDISKIGDVQLFDMGIAQSLDLSDDVDYNYNILLVEDNADLTHYISSILKTLGTVVSTTNGKDALNKLSEFTPDIIITDLMMPEMGGEEFITTLSKSQKWKHTPVIVLTAKAIEDEKIKLLKIGVVDYITKPFSAEQLVLKSKNLLKYYQARKILKLKLEDNVDSTDTEEFVHKVAAYIGEHVSNSNLSVDTLADAFSMSRSTFYRNIQLQTGMSPAEFLREIRLLKAREIVSSSKSIRLEELASKVGYKSVTTFRKLYQQRFAEHPKNGSSNRDSDYVE